MEHKFSLTIYQIWCKIHNFSNFSLIYIHFFLHPTRCKLTLQLYTAYAPPSKPISKWSFSMDPFTNAIWKGNHRVAWCFSRRKFRLKRSIPAQIHCSPQRKFQVSVRLCRRRRRRRDFYFHRKFFQSVGHSHFGVTRGVVFVGKSWCCKGNHDAMTEGWR